jgi:hypothetical protein
VGQRRNPAGVPRNTCGKRRLNFIGEYRVTRKGHSTASRSFGARKTHEKLGKCRRYVSPTPWQNSTRPYGVIPWKTILFTVIAGMWVMYLKMHPFFYPWYGI